MRKQLPSGHYFYFDDEDIDLVNSYKWHIQKGYVATEVGSRKLNQRKVFHLHRLILGASPGQLVDHRDRDPLNNRRENLRLSTRSTNGMNRTRQANNTSGFKGVSLHKPTGKYRAYITINRQTRHLGLFPNPEEAYEVYLLAARELHGEFACG